jgi:hypothetical protein
MKVVLIFGVCLVGLLLGPTEAQYYGNYYCQPGRDVVIQLFEWKWTDIEKECTWLAQNDYCGLQVSCKYPIFETLKLNRNYF